MRVSKERESDEKLIALKKSVAESGLAWMVSAPISAPAAFSQRIRHGC